ncbi:MAG: hypothetical protein ACRC0G_07840 [Fusobacteriaceae bacterium]
MKNKILIGLSLIFLLGCEDSSIDRRSPYTTALDYKRAALSDKNFTVTECDVMIISLDLYRDVQLNKYGEAYIDSDDAETWASAKRLFVQTRNKRLAGE